MQYDALKNRILLDRERRDEKLYKLLTSLTEGSAIQVSLNIPGPVKCPPGGRELFAWGQEQLAQSLAVSLALMEEDSLGPWALYTTAAAPLEVKSICCAIEQAIPAARLLDLDVYAIDGTAHDRASHGLAQRRCLVCAEPARDCIRTKRHSWSQIKDRLEELLEPYTAA